MKRSILLVVGTVLLIHSAEAQFIKSLKERVKMAAEETVQRKTEEKVVEKTDQVADKVLDAPFALLRGGNKESNGDQDPMAMLEGMMSGTRASYDEEYHFHTEVVMEFSSTDQKIERQQMSQFYGEKAMMTTLPQTSNKTIVDFENRSSLILNEENGSGMAISLDFMSGLMKDAAEEDMDSQPMTFQKTGNTKEILGYTCYEVVGEDEEMQFQAWYTQELDLKMSALAENLGNLFGNTDILKGMGDDEKGMALEIKTRSKKKGDAVTIKVLDIHTQPVTVSTSNYSFPSIQ
ncbi:DUF4412 domain-containing protein [Algoriphagus taiwanensis]|uniref:DUF4412 domain-containing protein n=1 Tax=Algoriphagus taiwanensis TaxID=1445656 RepID=A0ABQ6PY10_9BACT|nr:hypothetical protein Ataiwa_04420 [Algoriphagus taiwanensis]